MIYPLLPGPLSLASCQVRITGDEIVILARTMSLAAAYPACGGMSAWVHSRYRRRLADLPWHGRAVLLLLAVRRLFCDRSDCRRRIFSERVPDAAATRARQTERLMCALTGIGFACGGEGGAPLARRLGMPTSADTLLRGIRRGSLAVRPTPPVLGVDGIGPRDGRPLRPRRRVS